MKSKLLFFIIALITWTLLTWPLDIQHVLVGLIGAFVIALLAGDMFVTRPHLAKHPGRYFWLICFVPLFIWECLKANIDVAYRVMHPSLPINPGIVKIKTKLKSETGLTFLANAITLTPGTMTVDLDKEQGILYIHWISVKSQNIEEASRLIAGRFENILARIFD